jgi:hypothetical protein
VPSLSLPPPKWLWVPQADGSRLLWAASELIPRLGASEIFRRFAEKALNAVYYAEKSLFPKISRAQNYSPPNPLDLQEFFLQEWLKDLVKLHSLDSKKNAKESVDEKKSSKFSKQFPLRHLSSFAIAVPMREECFFVKLDSLIYGIGSPKGAGTLRMALLTRWARMEMDVNGWEKKEVTGKGKFLRRTKDYVEELNIFLTPLLGEKCFRDYEGRSLYAVAKKLREIL